MWLLGMCVGVLQLPTQPTNIPTKLPTTIHTTRATNVSEEGEGERAGEGKRETICRLYGQNKKGTNEKEEERSTER